MEPLITSIQQLQVSMAQIQITSHSITSSSHHYVIINTVTNPTEDPTQQPYIIPKTGTTYNQTGHNRSWTEVSVFHSCRVL